MNLLGVKQTARFELIVTVIAVVGLLLYFVLLVPEFSWNRLGSESEGRSFNWQFFFAAIPYAIWFFLAVEGVAMAAEEVKNPEKDIPLGYTAGIGTLILLAFGVLFTTAGTHSIQSVSELDYPLSYVLGSAFGEESWQAGVFTFIGLFGLIASLMGIILGYSRQIYSLAREGFLPKELSYVSRSTSIPSIAVLCGGSIGILAMVLGDTDQLITLAAMGACGMYVMSMMSFFKLRLKSQTDSNASRIFKVPFYPYTPLIALIAGLVCLFAMATFHKELFFLMVLGLMGLGILFQGLSRKKLGRIPRSHIAPNPDESLLSRGDSDIKR